MLVCIYCDKIKWMSTYILMLQNKSTNLQMHYLKWLVFLIFDLNLIVIAFAPDQKKKKVCIELLKEQDVNHSKYCILSKLWTMGYFKLRMLPEVRRIQHHLHQRVPLLWQHNYCNQGPLSGSNEKQTQGCTISQKTEIHLQHTCFSLGWISG